MRALELTIHPKAVHAHVNDGWFWDCDACNAVTVGPSKRLTNAECAAEYWRASLDLEFVVSHPDDAGTWDFTTMNEDVRRELILRRFATLPHYDEESNGKSD